MLKKLERTYGEGGHKPRDKFLIWSRRLRSVSALQAPLHARFAAQDPIPSPPVRDSKRICIVDLVLCLHDLIEG
jgi:hypothetical protein